MQQLGTYSNFEITWDHTFCKSVINPTRDDSTSHKPIRKISTEALAEAISALRKRWPLLKRPNCNLSHYQSLSKDRPFGTSPDRSYDRSYLLSKSNINLSSLYISWNWLLGWPWKEFGQWQHHSANDQDGTPTTWQVKQCSHKSSWWL